MSHKVPVCVRPEYTIYLQELFGDVWAHCDVRKWSFQVAKRMRGDWDVLYAMQSGPVLAMNEPTGDRKHQKFLAFMGFSFFKTVPARDGGTCLIFRRG